MPTGRIHAAPPAAAAAFSREGCPASFAFFFGPTICVAPGAADALGPVRAAVVVVPTYNEAENVGRLIPEILARDPRLSVLVVDDKDTLRYVEYVPEVTDHPDYDKALAAVKKLL